MSYNALFKKAARVLKSYLNIPDENDSGYHQSSNSYKYSNHRNSNSNSHTYSHYSAKDTENKNQNYQHQQSQSQSKQQQSSKSSNLKDEFYYYKVLGLQNGATVEDIKKAYKNLISQYHPDKVSNLGIDLQNLAKKKTQEINEAYQYFKNKLNF